MKKIANFILFFILCSLISCGMEQHSDMSEELTVKESILRELSGFNDSLHDSRCHSRVGAGQILYYLSVVSADVGGAYSGGCAGAKIGSFFGQPHWGAAVGAICGGGYASYKVHKALSDAHATRNSIVSDLKMKDAGVIEAYACVLKDEGYTSQNNLKVISLKDIDDSTKIIGVKHNLILENLETKNLCRDSLELFLSKEEIELLTSEEFNQEMDSVTNEIVTYVINRETIKENPKDTSAQIMNMFFEIFETYPNTCEDVELIIDKYIETVKGCDSLSESEKTIICQSLSVAASSYEYWKEYGI